MGVVDHEQNRSLRRQLRNQPQSGKADEEDVRNTTMRLKPKSHLQGMTLWLGQLMQKPLAPLTEGNNTQIVGQGLYGNYMLAFEVASLLLLVAIVGAVVMAKKKI